MKKKRRWLSFIIFTNVVFGSFSLVYAGNEFKEADGSEIENLFRANKIRYEDMEQLNYFNYDSDVGKEDNSLMACIVLKYYIDNIFNVLKKDKLINDYLNEIDDSNELHILNYIDEQQASNLENAVKQDNFVDPATEKDKYAEIYSRMKREFKLVKKRKEDTIKEIINCNIFYMDEKYIMFGPRQVVDLPLNVTERINKLFNEDKDIENILLGDKNADDSKIESIKDSAVCYVLGKKLYNELQNSYIKTVPMEIKKQNYREELKEKLKKLSYEFDTHSLELYIQRLNLERDIIKGYLDEQDKRIKNRLDCDNDYVIGHYKNRLNEIEKMLANPDGNEIKNSFNAKKQDIKNRADEIIKRLNDDGELENYIKSFEARFAPNFETDQKILDSRVKEILALNKEDLKKVYSSFKFSDRFFCKCCGDLHLDIGKM